MNNSKIGIENFGNTCFMNSVLQMLYSIIDIREFILESNSTDTIILSLKNIFNLLQFDKNYLKMREINNDFKELYNFAEFRTNRNFKIISVNESTKIEQQDAREFYDKIIDKIFTESYNLKELFIFQSKASSYCKKLNGTIDKYRSKTDNSTLLTLNIYGDKITLENLIDLNFKEEILDKNEYLKNDIINEYGNEIFNNYGIKQTKKRCNTNNINARSININIPNNNKYLIIQLARMATGEFLDNEIYINSNLNIHNNNYSLVGSILRYSATKRLNSGHYIYVTFQNNKIKNVYNDSKVLISLPAEFNLNNHSYILLYVKNNNGFNEQKEMQYNQNKLLKNPINDISNNQSSIKLYKQNLINEILYKINLATKTKEQLVKNKSEKKENQDNQLKALNNKIRLLKNKLNETKKLENNKLIEMQKNIQEKIQKKIERNIQEKIERNIERNKQEKINHKIAINSIMNQLLYKIKFNNSIKKITNNKIPINKVQESKIDNKQRILRQQIYTDIIRLKEELIKVKIEEKKQIERKKLITQLMNQTGITKKNAENVVLFTETEATLQKIKKEAIEEVEKEIAEKIAEEDKKNTK